MRLLKDYIRIALFFAGALAGLQFPAFIGQYEDTLNAHTLEAQRSLEEFQDDADRYFAGNLDALIRYYLNSEDEIFHEGGTSITALYNRYNTLNTALTDFRTSWFHALLQVSVSPQEEIRREVVDNYDYQVPLNAGSILWGVLVGLAICSIADLCLFTCGCAYRRVKHGKPAHHSH